MEVYLLLAVLNIAFVLIVAAPVSDQLVDDDHGEYGDYFEGDMRLTEEQYQAIEEAKIPHDKMDDNTPKNGIIDPSRRWPNKTVVYEIPDVFDEEQTLKIEEALQDIADNSCVKFRKKQIDDEYAVVFQNEKTGCFSDVGYNKGRRENETSQILNLSDRCVVHGTIVHEMLHTLGFYHMQSTYDRDDYVTIVFENIVKGMEHNFAKYTNDTVSEFGVAYDYDSVMHYGETAFSKNGNKTIIPKKEVVKIGQRKELSQGDIIKLNKMYECSDKAPTTEIDSILSFWDTITSIKP